MMGSAGRTILLAASRTTITKSKPIQTCRGLEAAPYCSIME